MALSLVPEAPLDGWLVELDAQIARSPAFFSGRPVVLDFTTAPRDEAALIQLVRDLQTRGLRIIGVESADPNLPSKQWIGPPLLTGGRSAEPDPPEAPPPQPPPEPTALVLKEPVRSGQSISFVRGDVTVVGPVASGAEVIAGGSVHIYGRLRGRAIAGAMGNPEARIFCRKFEAELVAIDGLYKTADDMPAALRGKAVQVWLEGEQIMMAALD
jgi:septum site-determining protein MinC